MHDFREYLYNYAVPHQSPVGDFIRDVRIDDTFPPNIKSWEQLRGYLFTQHACSECVNAAHKCWQNYKNWRKLKTKPTTFLG